MDLVVYALLKKLINGIPAGVTEIKTKDNKIIFVKSDGSQFEIDTPIYDDTDVQQSIKELFKNSGAEVDLYMDEETYQLKAILRNQANETISESTIIDLPLESMVISASFDEDSQEIILFLQSGSTTRIPVSALIRGLVSENDWASATKGGIVKVGTYNINLDDDHNLRAGVSSLEQYNNSMNENSFISKGTLERIKENYVTEAIQSDSVKAELSNQGFVTFDDVASETKTGVVKVSDTYNTFTDIDGALKASNVTYNGYKNSHNNAFISKGTLENVITFELNDTIINATYNAETGVLTFTKKDGSSVDIDLPLELLIESGYYDKETKQIVLTLANGDVIRINAEDLVDEYYADGVTLELTSVDGKQTFKVKDNIFATSTELDKAIQDLIDNDISNLTELIKENQDKLKNNVGTSIDLDIDSQTFELKAILKNSLGQILNESNIIDLPLETMVVGATYDDETKELVITLQNGNQTRVPVEGIISGLAKQSDVIELQNKAFTAIQFKENDSKTNINFVSKDKTNLGTIQIVNSLDSEATNAVLGSSQGPAIKKLIEEKDALPEINGWSVLINNTGTKAKPTDSIRFTQNINIPNSIAQRTADGILRGANAIEDNDLVPLNQLNTKLEDYVTFNDYASSSKPGLIKTSHGIMMDEGNNIYCYRYSYDQYQNNINNSYFISKGTLENVIEGRQLVSNTDLEENYVKYTDAPKSTKAGAILSGNYLLQMDGQKPYAGTVTYEQYNALNNGNFIGKGTLENVITGKGLISNTDYGTYDKGGVIKSREAYGFGIGTTGLPFSNMFTFENYNNKDNTIFISKGTLENVLNARIGLINDFLDIINGETLDGANAAGNVTNTLPNNDLVFVDKVPEQNNELDDNIDSLLPDLDNLVFDNFLINDAAATDEDSIDETMEEEATTPQDNEEVSASKINKRNRWTSDEEVFE